MKYTPLSKSLYQTNRSKFAVKLKPDSEEVFHSNDLIPTNADGTMKFRQNNDLLYLTGNRSGSHDSDACSGLSHTADALSV